MPIIHALFAGLFLLAADPQGLVRTAPPAVQDEPIAVPMELLASRPVIRVTLNGQGPFPFLIGPEDETTLIDPALAELLKIREQTSKEAPVELTVDLTVGSAKPIKVPIRIVDIARLAPEFAAAVRPRGILSLSAWKDHLVTLDYARYKVTIENGVLPEPNGKDVFALSASGELRLPLSIGEQSIECRVDPLFHKGVLLPSAAVDEALIDHANRDWSVLATRTGSQYVKEARVSANLTLGPFQLKPPVVLLSARGDTATIGAQWLGRFSVTYDLTNARARLDRPASVTDRRALK